MVKHTIISEASMAIVQLLREHLVPEVLVSGDSIGLCSPADKGDFSVCVHLYDIKESEEIQNHEMVVVNPRTQRYPSSYLTLYYMITPFSSGDVKYRSVEEQKILGKIVQVLRDYSLFTQEHYESDGSNRGEINLTMLPLSLEDKMRIFSAPNSSYKTSVFYKLSPIEVPSAKTKETHRVISIDFTIKE